MPKVVVGLDLHLNPAYGTVMTVDGKVVKQQRFVWHKETFDYKGSLKSTLSDSAQEVP